MSAAEGQAHASSPTRWLQSLLVLAIRGYRTAIAPNLAPACRFEPSCSAYAIEALERYGAIRGAPLAARRVARCHPWGSFGHDPVP